MFLNPQTQRTNKNYFIDEYLLTWVDAFLIDRKARGSAKGTLDFYSQKIRKFTNYCEIQAVKNISQISPGFIRHYLLYLEQVKHNPGGRHAAYRALRAFLLWYENEVEQVGWSNPIPKVKAPRVPIEPLEPVSFDTVAQMINCCKSNTFAGAKDKAILLFLLDKGVRANEFLGIDISDINQARGDILIRQGKGHKPRTVFIGKQTKRAVRRYLSHRKDSNPALWIKHPRFECGKLSYAGLRGILTRRALNAGVEEPSLHDFRRAFAISMLRNGTDIFTLAKLMGHEGITVLQRYLKQTNQDTEAAHRRAGPVDNGVLF
jgi:site-specific recombinase XerD